MSTGSTGPRKRLRLVQRSREEVRIASVGGLGEGNASWLEAFLYLSIFDIEKGKDTLFVFDKRLTTAFCSSLLVLFKQIILLLSRCCTMVGGKVYTVHALRCASLRFALSSQVLRRRESEPSEAWPFLLVDAL